MRNKYKNTELPNRDCQIILEYDNLIHLGYYLYGNDYVLCYNGINLEKTILLKYSVWWSYAEELLNNYD